MLLCREKIRENSNIKNNIPLHVAIIPDGNRRWAESHGLWSYLGHRRGAQVLSELLDTIIDTQVRYISFWAASMNNLTKRSQAEINFLNNLFEAEFNMLHNNRKIHEAKIRINFIGEWETMLKEKTKDAIRTTIYKTQGYNRLILNFFIAYNGINEILDSIRQIAILIKSGTELTISYDLIKSFLWSKELPSVDLLIRTGGEPHISAGFMMWHLCDTQLYFIDKYWPDFNSSDFKKAIKEYQQRNRRFGK